tara:strand:+ start:813 stop:1154 length:342 start_codon:yes stop_codon:yes gene_type:complete
MDFHSKLYKILDDNNILYERDDTNQKNRDVAIKIILEFKKRKAKKLKKTIVNDDDILNTYLMIGMEGIKTMFNRHGCYLYHTQFVYDILFYHYKGKWKTIESLIIKKIKNGTI